MKIYDNMQGRAKVLHIVDRPISQSEISQLAKWHPHGIVYRKSNGKATPIFEVRAKNFHWYE